jgi:N-methylhydantoinase B
MRLEGNEPATINSSGDGVEIAPPGLFGGRADQPHDFRLIPAEPNASSSVGEGHLVPSKVTGIPFKPGDVLCNHSAGGGGYGDPRERGLASVVQDLHDGLITPAVARDVYGLVGSEDAGEIGTDRNKR